MSGQPFGREINTCKGFFQRCVYTLELRLLDALAPRRFCDRSQAGPERCKIGDGSLKILIRELAPISTGRIQA